MFSVEESLHSVYLWNIRSLVVVRGTAREGEKWHQNGDGGVTEKYYFSDRRDVFSPVYPQIVKKKSWNAV